MLISKFDLYKSEWLELVFDHRNKAYGAYELRQHNGRTMAMAMGIAFLTIIGGALVVGAIIKPVVTKVAPLTRIIPVVIINIVHPAVITPPKPAGHIKPLTVKPLVAINPKVLVPFVVTSKPPITEPPKVTDLPQTDPGDLSTTPGSLGEAPGGTANGKGTGVSPGNGNEPVIAVGLERMPEPFGGAEAWAKFLKKHLNYPEMAIDQHMQGRVFVSFIIEKDGRLSNFSVDRGAGFGMDEEALRVLKLAPAWRPGIQNGQPVRVKYIIPINFQMTDDNN